MSDPVTEIAYIPISKDYSLESGEGKKLWVATLKTISEQKGFKRLSWGVQIENPSIAQMAIGKATYTHISPTTSFIVQLQIGKLLTHTKRLLLRRHMDRS